MTAVEYVLARQLWKTDLDTLGDIQNQNKSETVIKFGTGNRPAAERLLAGSGSSWQQHPGSRLSLIADLTVSNVPGTTPSQQVVQLQLQGVQGGKARVGELKLQGQRQNPIRSWSDPVRQDRPPEGDAWILLIKDTNGVHARYVSELSLLNPSVADRLQGSRRNATVALDFAASAGAENPLLGQVVRALQDTRNVLLYGPPGTGKTHLMQLVQQAFREGFSVLSFDPEATDPSDYFQTRTVSISKQPKCEDVEFLTFHPSTSYETFVVGLRPRIFKTALSYEVQAGPLLELAVRAARTGHAGLLLIDEINRGNAAEVFGELITLLELDKRLAHDLTKTRQTIGVRLPHTPDETPEGRPTDAPPLGPPALDGGRFFLPDEFYLVASMNSLDRSVAPLDSALRRRFRIVHLQPDLELLRATAMREAAHLPLERREDYLAVARLAHDLLAAVNEHLAVRRGPDYRLGHSYVLPVLEDAESTVDDLGSVVAERVLPQIEELLKGQPEALRHALGGDSNEGLLFRTHRPHLEVDDYGSAATWLEVLPFRENLDAVALHVALRTIADTATGEHWLLPAEDVDDPDEGNTGGEV